jgi:hypothetical protein
MHAEIMFVPKPILLWQQMINVVLGYQDVFQEERDVGRNHCHFVQLMQEMPQLVLHTLDLMEIVN